MGDLEQSPGDTKITREGAAGAGPNKGSFHNSKLVSKAFRSDHCRCDACLGGALCHSLRGRKGLERLSKPHCRERIGICFRGYYNEFRSESKVGAFADLAKRF